jgi:signal transduction histidine kinase
VRDETGHPDYFISVVEDISERKRVAQNQDFLIEASAILGASLDYQTTLVNVAELAVPHIADWCMIDLVDEHGAIHRLAVAHPDPAKVEVAYQLHQRYPQSTNTPYGLPQVLRTGHPEYVEDIPDDLLVATACDAEHLATLRALKLRSYLIVPLKARERTFGAITFVAAESGRRYGATDLVLAQELARRAALAIDNAHLYAAAQQARATAERVAVRTARLQRVAAALASALTPGQVAEVVLNEGVAALRARGGVIVRLTDDATELELVGAAGYPQPVLDTWSRFPVSASLPLADAVRTNEPIIVDSFAARTARYPHLTGEQAATGNGAMASIPLLENERVVGAMGFSFDPQRTLVEEDRMFLLALARLCSQAFERARLYEAEQQAHTTAQEAMQREHQRATQLHGMANASLVINSTLSLSAMLQTVTEQARHLIGAHQAVASLTADEHWNQSINAISLSDKYAAWRTLTTPLPYGSEMYAVVCRTNTPLRMTQAELEAHPAWRNVGSEHGSYPPVHGWLAAPLIGRSGQNLGVLQLSDKYVGEFSAEDEAILVQLAHLASAAIENASLYQAAQEAVRLRDEFLSIASHELKTPITSMKLQIQTLLRAARRAGDDGVDPQRLIGKLQATERQVERLTSLVDELLDISRVAAGRLELRSEWHDLASIVRDVAARFEEELARANCILVLHADMPVEGWWDSFRLEQIITNLVSNALKYGAGHPIEVAVMAHGAQAQLVVRDHGIGIAAEDVERIFAPFERAVSSKHYGGLGLGLFIVGQITAALGGTIRVTSTPNVGSTFTIDLPRERQAAESSQR